MIIGVSTIKPYKKLNKQYIGTQFFILGIPLFPINSFFIIDSLIEKGFEIGIYWKHLVKIYSGIISFILFFLMIIPDFIDWSTLTKTLIVLLSFSTTLFLIFKFDKMDEKEKEKRLFFEKIVGINALPNYMNNQAAIMLRNKFIIQLKNQIETKEHWNEIIAKELYTEKDLQLMYIISEYQFKINPNSTNEKTLINFKQKNNIA